MSYQGPPWQSPKPNRYHTQPRGPQQSRPRPPKKKHSFWFLLFFGLFILYFRLIVLCFRMLRAFWRWYSKQTRRTQVIVGAIIAIVLVIASIVNAISPSSQSASIPAPTPTPTQAQVVDQSTQDTSLLDTPTDVPTTPPTPIPTMKQKPTPHPTQPPPPPKPTPTHCVGINGNPWCYDFNPGNLIYNPPSNFCAYFNCIPSFWGPGDPGDGFVNQCADGTFSQSGGESGDCSYHGGEGRPLYSH